MGPWSFTTIPIAGSVTLRNTGGMDDSTFEKLKLCIEYGHEMNVDRGRGSGSHGQR